LEQAADRLHAGFHHRVLQVAHQQIELADRLVEGLERGGIGFAGNDVSAQASQTVFGEANLPRQIEYLIETRGVDADRVFFCARRRGGGGGLAPFFCGFRRGRFCGLDGGSCGAGG